MPAPDRRPRSPLTRFFVTGALWLVALTLAWSFVADWTMRPAAWTSTWVLKTAYPWWVKGGQYVDDSLDLETRLQVPAASAPTGAVAVLVATSKPAHYGYGLPMLLALLLASGRRRPSGRILLGVAALVPVQAFSICFDLLRQVVILGGPAVAAQTGFTTTTANLVAICYQLGVLLLPALAPIVIWLVIEKDFLATLVGASAPATPDAAGE
jgi:hypothetical protein